MPQEISRRFFLALTGGALSAWRFAGRAEAPADPHPPAMLDHILLGCSDLERGIDFVEQRTGVRAAFGGVHPGRGTRNALLSLGERHYFEIIAPDPKQETADVAPMILRTAVPLLDHLRSLGTPQLVGWAEHPGDLTPFAARLRDAGLAFDGPTAGSRKRPDGRLLQWKALNLRDDHGGLLPFFIEWSADSPHPSEDALKGCALVDFSLETPKPAEIKAIGTLLNLDVRIEQGEASRLHARIAGLNGKIMTVTS